jgi:hypothetical protein
MKWGIEGTSVVMNWGIEGTSVVMKWGIEGSPVVMKPGFGDPPVADALLADKVNANIAVKIVYLIVPFFRVAKMF